MNKIAAILWCILSLAWTTASWAQNVAVSGKVTGANGEAIIGANVLVEGTTQGITTNVDGDYTLTNVPANARSSSPTWATRPRKSLSATRPASTSRSGRTPPRSKA